MHSAFVGSGHVEIRDIKVDHKPVLNTAGHSNGLHRKTLWDDASGYPASGTCMYVK